MKRLYGALVSVVLTTAVPIHGEAVRPIKAAVLRSTGTQFLGQTIWPELNAGWSSFGDVPVEIDWWSLAGSNITDSKLEASGADVVVLSNPAFVTYTANEISAVIRFIEAGKGLLITYGKFRSEDRALAPLVGLSETIALGTGTATDPFWIEPGDPADPLFKGVTLPYVAGAREATTLWGSAPWPLAGGSVAGQLLNGVIARRPGIVVNETDSYRGVYFSYYVENRSGGAGKQDMQVFYNSLLWASVPEPTTAVFLLSIASLPILQRGTTHRRRTDR